METDSTYTRQHFGTQYYKPLFKRSHTSASIVLVCFCMVYYTDVHCYARKVINGRAGVEGRVGTYILVLKQDFS